VIAIVGAGAAGISAAVALRELGYEREIRVFGAESTAPYDRTTLSKSFLAERAAPPPLLDEGRLADLDLVLGSTIVDLDTRAKTLTSTAGEAVPYDQLLLATGARCRRLEIEGADLAGIHYLRELADAIPLRAALDPGSRVVVVGGGVIGLELAASALGLGCAVTVIEAAPRVMGRVVPHELSDLIASEHRARGVEIRTGIPPVAFTGRSGKVTGVTLTDDAFVPADAVVVGVGVTPDTDLAARAGIAVEDGIVVDERFCTSNLGVFAAGDAARVFHQGRRTHLRTESWYPAQDQGRLAAAGMLGRTTGYTAAPWMWSEQYDLTIQVAGFGVEGDDLIRRGSLADGDGVCYFARDGRRLAAAAGVSAGARIGRTITLARRLIEAGAEIDPDALRDTSRDLKSFLVDA
jgi:3-phenylpropionate/trans-cinnamate dioxygenase ferredoxin reductase subunit